MKVCSLTSAPPKPNAMISAVHLKEELEKLVPVDVYAWNYYNKVSTTFAPLWNIIKLRRALKRYDIVHVQYDLAGYMPLFLPILWLLSFRKKAKIVLTLHEKFDNVPLSKLVITFHNLFYRVADLLITHTIEHKEFLAKALQGRTKVIPHGVISQGSEVVRKPQKHSLLMLGFVQPWKGHDIAIKALVIVVKKYTDTKLTIIGPGDSKFIGELRELIKKLKLEKNVVHHEKYSPEAEALKFYDNTEVTLLPYTRITMSGVLSHVISRHVPAIMSDLPVFKEFTKNKAVYFKNWDYKDLAKKIIYLLNNRDVQRKISQDFAKLAEEYSWRNVAKETFKIYNEVCTK